MRWGTTLGISMIALVGGCGGCGGDDGDDADGGVEVPRETWAVRCHNRFPIAGIVPLGADENDLYVRLLNDEETPVVGGTTRGGLTRDGGTTVSLVPLEVDVGTGSMAERRANILGAVPEIVGVGPHFFSSMRPRLDAGSNSAGYPAYRVIVVDGEGKEVGATSGSAAGVPRLPGGAAADQAWPWDAQRWVARDGFRMFATEDGGASWQPTGLALEVRVGGRLLATVGTLGDRVIVQDRTDPAVAGPYYLVADDGDQTEVPVTGAVGDTNPALLLGARLRPWGERLVYTHRGQLWVSEDLGATWTPLPAGETTSMTGEYDVAVDGEGNLYAYPIETGDGDVVVYRYAPGGGVPTAIDLDFDGLVIRELVDLGALAGGRVRFVAHPRPTRETYAWFLCTAEPGGVQAIEHAAVESMDAAYASGRVVRLQRFKELSLHTDRMALSGYGRPYVTSFQHLLTLPQDAPYFYDGRTASAGLGVLPGALVPFASEWRFQAYLWSLGVDTADALFDARTGKVFEQSANLVERVYGVGAGTGPGLLRTATGTYSSSATIRLAGDPPVPRWSNQVVMDRQHGAVLSNLAYDRFFDLLEPAYLVRFDPTTDRVPSLSACYPDPPGVPPASCIPAPPMSVIAATFDADGSLYALDMRRGRVMMLPAGASSGSAWRAVGEGFSAPSDLQVVPYGDGWMAVVYDGDVWAFAIDPAAPKVRGAAAPERADEPVIAARDAHDCTEAGPCLDDAGPAVDLVATGAACLAGRGLGGATGRVLAGATPLEIMSWSETQVCVRAPAELRDGQLQVVRADGAASNRLPYRAASRFAQWDIPAEVYPDTPVRARGHNLQRGGDHAVVAWGLEAGQHQLAVGRPTETTTTVTVRPRVRHGCRVGRREACTIYGAGFGASGTSATIGGLPATIAAWSRFAVSLDWPPALAPGVHAVTLAGPGWSASAGTVELLADGEAPLLLQHDAPQTSALRYLHPRPVLTSRGLFASMDDWAFGTVDGQSVPLDVMPMVVAVDAPESAPYDPGEVLQAATLEQGDLTAERPLHVIEHGGEVYFVGTDDGPQSAATVIRRVVETIVGGTTVYSTPEVARFTFAMDAQVAAAGIVDGHAIVVAADRIAASMQVTAVALAGASTTVVDTELLAATAPARPTTHGGFFAGRDLYLTTCHDPDRGARIERVAVAVTAGALTLAPGTLVRDVPAARLVACATTADGLLWIEREGAAYRVMRTIGGAAPVTVTTLPATLPGVGDVHTFNANDRLDGVTDVALLSDGDLLVLLNEHDTEPRGLHLARRDAASGAWTTRHAVTPAAMMQRGEVCVGPVFSAFACPTYGRDGCSPTACAQRPPEVRPRASTHIGEAYMVVRGADVSLVYEAVDTERVLASALPTGYDVLHVRAPLP